MTIINASRGTSKKYVDTQDDLRTKAINDEVTRATGVETGLRNDLTAESNTARAAERANATAITEEQDRATAAEAAIEDQVWVPEKDDVPAHYGTVTQAVLDDAKVYTNEQITQRVTQVYSVQGSCTYTALLAKTGQEKGNVWNVTTANYGYRKGGVEVPPGTEDATWSELQVGDPSYVPPGTNWVWVEDNPETHAGHWDAMGGSIDLSTYETTAAVDTKLTEYSKTTTINGVLAQHQNLIKKTQVTLKPSAYTTEGGVAMPAFDKNGTAVPVEGILGEDSEIIIVSPEPESIQKAVDYGIYASAYAKDRITFKADEAIAANDMVTFDVTIISTATGTQIN